MIDRASLKNIRADVDAALAVVGTKHSIALEAGNATFSPSSFTMKVIGTVLGQNTPEQELYDRNAARMRLPPRGSEVTLKNTPYIVVGMRPRGKNTVVLERKVDGKVFVGSPDVIAAAHHMTTSTPAPTIPPIIMPPVTKSAVSQVLTPEGYADAFNSIWREEAGGDFGCEQTAIDVFYKMGTSPLDAVKQILSEQETELRAEAMAS